MIQELKTPFVWFGGKARAAHLIWPRLGNPVNYAEPFAGSLAVLLRRPHQPSNEIINDLDCYVSNAWRATKSAPKQVAEFTDWPTNEADLHSRHRWLHGREDFRERMKNDPDFFDARIAGYWMWGLSCWIGDNFRRPNRNTSAPHLTGGQGDFDDMQPSESSPPDWWSRRGSESQGKNLLDWFNALANRLRFTKVCCGEWDRVLSKAATYGQGLTGVLLDPPYDTDGHTDVYGDLSRGVSGKVREWAIENGNNPLLRIVLCGYDSEHKMPPEWDMFEWKATGGYGNQSGNENAHRERLWFSPHCIKPEPELFKL